MDESAQLQRYHEARTGRKAAGDGLRKQVEQETGEEAFSDPATWLLPEGSEIAPPSRDGYGGRG